MDMAMESYDLARQMNVRLAMVACAGNVGSMFLQIGDTLSGERWIKHAVELHSPDGQTVLDVNTCSYRTELAIRMGDISDAADYFERCMYVIAETKATRSHLRALSLRIQLALLRGSPVCANSVDTLYRLYKLTRETVLMDFNTESLLLGLNALGRGSEARIVAESYVNTYRRDRAPLAKPLQNLISSLAGASPHC